MMAHKSKKNFPSLLFPLALSSSSLICAFIRFFVERSDLSSYQHAFTADSKLCLHISFSVSSIIRLVLAQNESLILPRCPPRETRRVQTVRSNATLSSVSCVGGDVCSTFEWLFLSSHLSLGAMISVEHRHTQTRACVSLSISFFSAEKDGCWSWLSSRRAAVVETPDVCVSVQCATNRARLSSSTFLIGQATNLSVSPLLVESHSNIIRWLSQTNDVLAASQKRWKGENEQHTHHSSSNQSIKQSPHFLLSASLVPPFSPLAGGVSCHFSNSPVHLRVLSTQVVEIDDQYQSSPSSSYQGRAVLPVRNLHR